MWALQVREAISRILLTLMMSNCNNYMSNRDQNLCDDTKIKSSQFIRKVLTEIRQWQ